MEEQKYHRAKQWEIAFFSLNNSATNIYLLAFGFLTYYATGVMGLATLTIANIMGLVRLFDGLIDPTIGVMIDRTNTRFGKYRPYMVVGNIMLIISFLILFNTHRVEGTMQFVVYVFALIFHKIGYSLQQTVTKAAQPALTNDPAQRPLFSIYDTIFSSIGIFACGQVFISQFLVPKNGGVNLNFLYELITYVMIISAVITVLAIIGIWRKDNVAYYGIGEKTVETKSFKDYWAVVKGNRPLLTLVFSAGIMKFVAQMFADATFTIMLFGIVLGNYGLSGTFSLYQIIPNLLLIMLLTRLATQKGMRFVYNNGLLAGIVAVALACGILLMANASGSLAQLFGGSSWSLLGWLFVALFLVARILLSYPAGAALIMAADITNYETARSGRYVSGLIGTVFSFVDSITSSFVPVVVGWVCVAIGYTNSLPKPEETLTAGLFNGTMIIFGLVIVGAVIALILGWMYPLTKEKMEEVQREIATLKAEADEFSEEA